MKSILTTLLLVSLVVPICLGQEATSKPQRRKKPAIRLIPFHQVSKAAGFEILHADKAKFNEMSCFMFTATSENCPKLTKPTNVVQLTYGYKKSGIAVAYLAPMAKGLKAEDVIQPLVDGHIFRDRQYFKEWSIKTVANSRLLVMVSGTTPEVRDELIRGLK